jgi:hypothetical protein
MAEFEELKLSVNLVDNASAGLANIRSQIVQLTQVAGQAQGALGNAANAATQLANSARNAAPHLHGTEKSLKELTKSSEETARGLLHMALAAPRGAEGFAELALGAREAWTGFSGVNTALKVLAPEMAATAAVVGIAAIGFTALAAAVVATGVVVFEFASEVNKLNLVAKTLGMSFGELKNIVDESAKFGVATETVIHNLAGIQKAMVDLANNNSGLRRRMLSEGVDAGFVESLARQSDPRVIQNMLVVRAREIEKARLAEGQTRMQARGRAGQFLEDYGVDRGALHRELVAPPDPRRVKQQDEIARLSEETMKTWGEIGHIVENLKFEALGALIPILNVGLSATLWIFQQIEKAVNNIKIGWHIVAGSAALFSGRLPSAWEHAKRAGELGTTPPGSHAHPGAAEAELGETGVPGWERFKREHGGASPTPGAAGHEATPATPGASGHETAPAPFSDRFHFPASQTRGLQGANDNVNPLLHPASFGGDEGRGGSPQEIIKAGVYDALVAFFVGGGAAGGAGVRNAAFSPDGAGGGGGGGGGGFKSAGGFNVLQQGANVGGQPHGSHVGPGTGDGAGDTPPAGGAGGNIDAAAQAIRTIESGSAKGNYGAMGPRTKSGDRAYGAYQVMGANVGNWTEKHFGKRLTPQEFLQNKEAQDAVFKGEFGGYMEKYGPEGAAQAWFGGPGAVGKPGGKDVLGTSVGGYGSRFSRLYAGAGGGTGDQAPQQGPTPPNRVLSGGTLPESSGVPSQFASDVQAMTLAGSQPHDIRQYLLSKGVNLNVATCGQFMAAVVKDHGGTPPPSAAVASNWNTFGGKEGAGYSDDPNAINVAVRQGTHTGDTGSHVTSAIPIRDKAGNITGYSGVGVNQGYGRSVISSHRLSIGTGPGQYQIRHQIPTKMPTANARVPGLGGGGTGGGVGTGEADTGDPTRGLGRDPGQQWSHGQQWSGRMSGEAGSDEPAQRETADDAYDRTAIDRQNSNGGGGASKGQLYVKVEGPGKATYEGTGLLRPTTFERQTAGQLTKMGPPVAETASQVDSGASY